MIFHPLHKQRREVSSCWLGMALLLLSAALSGCATSTKFPYDNDWREQVHDLRIIDERPAVEKTAEIMSTSLLSERYGEYRLGDAQVVPERTAYLTGRLMAMNPGRFAGKTAQLRHFEIFNKLGNAHRKAASQVAAGVALAGAAGSAVAAGVSSSSDGAVGPTPTSDWAFIELYVELILEGKAYSSTQIVRYHGRNRDAGMRFPEQALKVAVRGAAEELNNKIGKE